LARHVLRGVDVEANENEPLVEPFVEPLPCTSISSIFLLR
jgi:hypothetical protein